MNQAPPPPLPPRWEDQPGKSAPEAKWIKRGLLVGFILITCAAVLKVSIERSDPNYKSQSARKASDARGYRDEWPTYLKSEQALHDALTEGQRLIYGRLKAPSTAEFAPFRLSQVRTPEPGKFILASYVDAQNAFGAKLRNRFVCRLEVERGKVWIGRCELEQ